MMRIQRRSIQRDALRFDSLPKQNQIHPPVREHRRMDLFIWANVYIVFQIPEQLEALHVHLGADGYAFSFMS